MMEDTIHPSTKIPEYLAIGTVLGALSISLLLRYVLNIRDSAVFLLLGLLVFVVVARFIIQILLLKRTSYTISEDILRKEFTLLYRRSERQVPVKQIRGVETTQTALQTWLGFGNVTIITAGPNRSLGFLEFKHIPDSSQYTGEIEDLVS